MNCPKDADNTKEGFYCNERYLDGSFLCTRKKGHRGAHHAHGLYETCCVVWLSKSSPNKKLVKKGNDAETNLSEVDVDRWWRQLTLRRKRWIHNKHKGKK